MGAGPAGLTAAWELVAAGREIVVWEADASYVGGLARTVQAEGYRIDVGGHWFFSKSSEVNEIWRKILPEDFIEIPRRPRIYYQGEFFAYPFRNGLFTFGLGEGLRNLVSAIRARLRPIKPEFSFAQRWTNRLGQRLFENFYRAYHEKLLGLSADAISADVAALRLREDEAAIPANRRFFYPRLGPGQMWETAANKLLERGTPIFLDRKVQTVHWDETGVTHITGTNAAGEFFQQEGSHFISSIPLRELLLALDPPPPKEVAEAARALRHRDFITVCLIVNRETVFPDTTLYIYDASVRVAHIQNYKNWSPALQPEAKTTSLGMEYHCFEGDNLWNSTDFDLAQLAIREIAQLGLAKEAEIKDAYVVRMPKAFPVYDQDYERNLAVIKQWVGLFANLQPVGRNGLHRDNNQDHSMMTAILAVRNIQGGSYDCWKVNAEAAYPERAKS